MRYSLKRFLSRSKRKVWYDYYLQIWFKYHRVFFGSLIFNGKKLHAFNFFLKVKQGLKFKERFDPYFLFLVSMMRVTPDMVIIPVKLGGSSQGVPMPITEKKRITFAIKWTLRLLKDKRMHFSVNSIVDLLISSIYKKGLSIDKKLSIYKMSAKNRHLLKFFRV